MKEIIRTVCYVVILLAVSKVYAEEWKFPIPQGEYHPRHYQCLYTESKIIVDGCADDSAWNQAYWTDSFIDIEGSTKPKPYYNTRLKMLWDTKYLYIYADMEERDVSANLTDHDAVIFHDNDFEVFIDPDGDTHNYYEMEMNAMNTVWDLLLLHPYREGWASCNRFMGYYRG